MSEYINRAAQFAQSAAQLSKNLSENLVENAKDFRIDNTLQLFENGEDKLEQVKTLLDSKYDKEKLTGLKILIAMISKGKDVSDYFAPVVKLVASTSLEVRKLVYIYLIRYAEQEPDLALLSVNTFQKDLSDSNPVIRAMALRVMSSIRVKVIAPIVLLAIRKCVADLSPYVRKSAAFAMIKLYELDPNQKKGLIELIEIYLKDESAISIGGAITAFNELCPTRYDLIHVHYRKLCYMLVEVDEWSQIAMLHLLTRYARTHFLNPNQPGSVSPTKKDFYSDVDALSLKGLDPDHSLLLRMVLPLLKSQNSSVVLQTASLMYHLAPINQALEIGKPLVRLLRSYREIQFIVLTNILAMVNNRPEIFSSYLNQFFVRPGDNQIIRDLKLEILTSICDAGNALVLLSELGEYVRSPDTTLAVVAIQAIGRLSNKIPSVSETCLEGLMTLVQQKNPAIVGESVVVIKRLLQTRPREQNTQHICTLIYNLEYVVVPLGKSSILWLVGQYADLVPQYAPDILRQFCKTFKEEEVSVKLQILTLASKLLISLPQEPMIPKLFDYVIQLARYDVDYDLRDRARFLKGFHHLNEPKDGEALDVTSLSTHLKTILLSEKSAPKYLSSSEGKEHFTIGSASLQVGHKVNGYEPLPEWPTEKPDGSLRNKGASSWTAKSTASVSTPSPAIGHSKTSPTSRTSFAPKSITSPKQYANDLDAFYDDVDMDSNPLRTSNIRESYESEEESDEDDEDEDDEEEESEYETDEDESEYEETEDDSEEESEYSSDSEVEGQHLLNKNRR